MASQWFSYIRVLRFPPPIKNYHHNITEVLLKVALNTIKQALKVDVCFNCFGVILTSNKTLFGGNAIKHFSHLWVQQVE